MPHSLQYTINVCTSSALNYTLNTKKYAYRYSVRCT